MDDLAQRSPTLKVRIRGEWACFTRPEPQGGERRSYEVMTPSAARGVLEAIFWKPAIQWRIERIHVLAPIRFHTFRMKDLSPQLQLRGAIGRFFADERRERQDTVILRDVDYVVEASFSLTAEAGHEDIKKFQTVFLQRIERGECFHNPYLGCSEFDARVDLAPPHWTVPEELRGRRELGLMLLDIRFKDKYGMKPVTPLFFDAVIEDGVIEVPDVPR